MMLTAALILLELLSTMQPTRQALDEILGFFQARLAG